MNGSPVNPLLQLQIGLWFITVHLEPIPQEFGQGSEHLLFKQAIFEEHSELTVHSGLQNGGEPVYVGKQEQTACSLNSRHWLFGPQGEGAQGSTFSIGFLTKIFNKLVN